MTQTNQKAAIDARLVNPIIESTVNVLGTMANTKATLKQVVPVKASAPVGDISAVIGILGNDGEGNVSLLFPEPLAKLIVSRMLGMDISSISIDDACDGVGELVNMISGNAKTALSQESNSLYKLTLPTVIRGKDLEVSARPSDCPSLLILFDAEEFVFGLHVFYQLN